jgi:hypothetical protein
MLIHFGRFNQFISDKIESSRYIEPQKLCIEAKMCSSKSTNSDINDNMAIHVSFLYNNLSPFESKSSGSLEEIFQIIETMRTLTGTMSLINDYQKVAKAFGLH